jgi:hypothetical protein
VERRKMGRRVEDAMVLEKMFDFDRANNWSKRYEVRGRIEVVPR